MQVEEAAQAARAAAGRPVASQYELIELQVRRRASPVQQARPGQERHGFTHCGRPTTLCSQASFSVEPQRWEAHPESPPGCPVALRGVSRGFQPSFLTRCARARSTPPQGKGSWRPGCRSPVRPVPVPPWQSTAGRAPVGRNSSLASRRSPEDGRGRTLKGTPGSTPAPRPRHPAHVSRAGFLTFTLQGPMGAAGRDAPPRDRPGLLFLTYAVPAFFT